MSIFNHIKGIAGEVLDLPGKRVYLGPANPRKSNATYRSLGRDDNGYSVYEIKARNYAEAAELTDGNTVEGPVHKSLNRTGHNTWQSQVECDDVYFYE